MSIFRLSPFRGRFPGQIGAGPSVRHRPWTVPQSRVDALLRQVPGARWDVAHRAAVVGILLPVPQRLLFHVPVPSC
jgi:hypothetical protein